MQVIKPTKKNSPAIVKAKGKYNGPAVEYQKPHTMKDKPVTPTSIDSDSDLPDHIGLDVKMPTRKNWTPLNGTVSIGNNHEVKTSGEETRGNGAAERGRIARGPMA
jgi:hypothetical protein